MRIDSSGNVGIGETSAQGKLHVKSGDSGATADSGANELVVEGSGNSGISILSGASASGAIYYGDSGSAYDGWLQYDQSSRRFNIGVANGTRWSVFSDGDLRQAGSTNLATVFFMDSGTTQGAYNFTWTTDGSSAEQQVAHLYVQQGSGDGAAQKAEFVFQVADNGAPATALTIANNGVVSGNLNDTSDVALKENITDLGSATAKLKQLQPRTFDWKQASKGTGIAGFIAQEVASVIPEAVVGKDYEAPTYYADGDTIPDGKKIGDQKSTGEGGKAINASAILAYAVKTIQELEARIQTLEDA
jgi:hypothetical protein